MSLALINAKEMLDKDLNSLHEIPGKTKKCDICDKIFSHSGYLRTHREKVHKIGFARKCGICSKSFLSSENFKEHKSCHEVEGNKCDICDKTFSLI